mgnify:CR=1 FL=1
MTPHEIEREDDIQNKFSSVLITRVQCLEEGEYVMDKILGLMGRIVYHEWGRIISLWFEAT